MLEGESTPEPQEAPTPSASEIIEHMSPEGLLVLNGYLAKLQASLMDEQEKLILQESQLQSPAEEEALVAAQLIHFEMSAVYFGARDAVKAKLETLEIPEDTFENPTE